MLNPERVIPNLAEQGVLFSESFVGDRLHPNHQVYAFKELISKLDLSPLVEDYSYEGGQMFSPRDLFALTCYGYTKGICSSYQLADAVANRLDFIFLAGGHHIKRRTLSDFRNRHRKVMAQIFVQTVELADKVGLIEKNGVFALDGTKIHANANRDQRKDRSEWQKEREKLRENIETFLDNWDKADAEEESLEEEESQRIQEIRKQISQLPQQKIEITKDEKNDKSDDPPKGNSSNRKKPPKDSQHALSDLRKIKRIDKILEEHPDLQSINLTDPEARVMKEGVGTNEAYNVQAISNNSIIVALDLTQEENDQHQLQPMTEQLMKNLSHFDMYRLLADAGYNAGFNLAYLERYSEIDAFVSMYERKDNKSEYDRKNFIFDEDNDEYTCPKGKILENLRDKKKNDEKHSVYAANIEDCIYCPVRKECLSNKDDVKRGYRTIEDDCYAPFRHAMRAKVTSPEGRKIYRQRAGEIEPRFGWKKRITLPQFRLRSCLGAKAEAALSSTASNIMQILRRTDIFLPSLPQLS